MPHTLNQEIIAAAIEGFEAQKRRIDEQIAELRAMVTGQPTAIAAKQIATSGKKKLSAASRRKMALAQKARWARLRGDVSEATGQPAKPKRQLSEEGRKRIIAATKKRWRLQRAAQKQNKPKR